MIFILLLFSGCGAKQKELTIDDKINSEIEYLDNKVSDNMSKIISSVEVGEALKVEEASQKNDVGSKKSEEQGSSEESSSKKKSSSGQENDNEKNNGSSEESSENKQGGGQEENGQSKQDSGNKEGNDNKQSGGNESKKSSDRQSNMSVQYSEDNKESDINWDDIMKNTQEISDSWNVIESDLLTKQELRQSDFDNVKNSIDNLIADSSNKERENTIRDSADFYNGICTILDKLNYDKNKYDMFRIKQYIYEAYYDVLTDNWENVKINIETANTKIKHIDNVGDDTKIAFDNLLSSVEKKNNKAFYIRCSDVLKRIEQINF